MIKKIVLQRKLKKRIDGDKIKQQLQEILSKAFKSGRGRGWIYLIPDKINQLEEKPKDKEYYTYEITLEFKCTSNHQSVQNKLPVILKRLSQVGTVGNFQGNPWTIISPSGYEYISEKSIERHEKSIIRKGQAEEDKELGEVSLDKANHFDKLYGRESQVNRILGALKLGKRTNWLKRTHTILDGDPGCGKTECMLATSRMLGEENKAWKWFDATSMTKAGVLEEIMQSPVVPPVLFIEEIEKCEEHSLRWLLGVMDTRGQVRRTNYRVGNQAKNVRMCIIATANDVALLKSLMSGALYSRFQNKIYCPRPDRIILEKILQRELNEIKGKQEWIEPTLQFGFDKWEMNDPRDLITIMSCGGDDLLTGDYQKDYENTMHPLDKKGKNKSS